MDKLDRPEISTNELTAEVRKAMTRQRRKRYAVPTNDPVRHDTSAPESAPRQPDDNSNRLNRLSPDTNFSTLPAQPSFPQAPKLELQADFVPNPENEYHLNDL